MPRNYRNIKEYEAEIFRLREEGHTQRQIGEKLGFTKKQITDFVTRHNRNQRKLSAGIVIRPKGRPRKNEEGLPPSIQQLNKVTQLQYELARKEARIRQLEMENELMRDFLSLTERK